MLAGVVAAALIIPGASGRDAAPPGALRLDAAAMVLHRAARAALTAPSPGANEFIYVATRVHDPQNPGSRNWVTREWMSISKGTQQIAQVPSCGSVYGGAFKHDRGCWLAPFIMGELPFTYTGLGRLPTSARALLGYLSTEQHQACGALGKRMSQAEREWSGVYTILDNVPVLPPHFGAALFNATARIPGVRVIRNVKTATGQPGIAVARTVHVKGGTFIATQAELIFSPHTYRYIGNVLDRGYTGGGTRQSSTLITTRFTSTYPHHSQQNYSFPVPGCIGQVASGS